MALPGSGTITLAMIAAEFGGATPHSISEYYRGGGLVPSTPVNAAIPTSGAISFSQFYNASAHTAPGININNQTVTGHRSVEPNPFPPPGTIRGFGTATYRLLNNGQASKGETVANDPQTTIDTNFGGEWLTSGSVADAEVECVVSGPQAGAVGGSPTGSGVWSNLATSRSWNLLSNLNGASASLAITIRDSVTAAILDTATISLSVTN